MMKPLPQRTIFTCEFNDLLSNNTTPERTSRRNLCSSKSSNIFNQVHINTLNFEILALDFYLFIFVLVHYLNQLLSVIIIQGLRKTVMLGKKVVDSVKN